MSVWQFLALGYLVVILLGSLLLTMPFSSKSGEFTDYIDALFTATSATCITGLAPLDTGTHWSVFGQVVILLLIQTGGLGFMTFVTAILHIVGKNMGLHEKKILMVSAGEEDRSDLRRLFKRLVIGTAIIELAGALLLCIRFIPDFGLGKGIYFSIFHAVSAFCNAGFDLFGGAFQGETFVSLTHYANDPIVILTISLLIMVGGFGFCVWDDVIERKCSWKKYSLHTRVVFIVTGILVLVSTSLFLIFEASNPAFGDNFFEKLLSAFFAAISPRTAGFSSVSLSDYSESSAFLTIILMFIGGSSGSTAGGVKITTFAVVVMGMLSVFRGKKDIEVGKRRVHSALLHQALAICTAYLFFIVVATLSICAIEEHNHVLQEGALLTVLFEVVSALGTVGLSMSLTPTLTIASKLILILLMYLGRVGVLTLAFALRENKNATEIKKPVGHVLIG